MKKSIHLCFLLLLAFAFFNTQALAHGGDHDEKKEKKVQQDSLHQHDGEGALEGDLHENGEEGEHAHSDEETASLTEFPTLHPLIVHFPIVLLITAAIFQILSFFFYREAFSWAAFWMLLLGAVGAYISSSYAHPHTEDLTLQAANILEEHERFADWTVWLSVAALVVKIISQFFLKQKQIIEIAVAALLVGASVSVSLAGHHGAQLVHLEGVGPKGEFLELGDHDHDH